MDTPIKTVIYNMGSCEMALEEACRLGNPEGLSVVDGGSADACAGPATGADRLVVIVSNRPGDFSVSRLFGALRFAKKIKARKTEFVFYSWSGRHLPVEVAGEVAAKAAGTALRPLCTAFLKAAYAAGEAARPLSGRVAADGGPAGAGRVLCISLDLVGDLVWAAPAISSIKKFNPAATVDLLVSSANAGLARMIEGVDEVIAYDAPWLSKVTGRRGSRYKNLVTRLSLLRRRYGLTVDFRGEPRDHVLAYFTGAPARAGYLGRPAGSIRPSDVEFMLTHPLKEPADGGHVTHIFDRNLALTESLGYRSDRPGRWLMPDGRAGDSVKSLLASYVIHAGEGGPLVTIQPGASRREKMWPAEGFAEVARGLMENVGAKVVIAGSADEAGLAAVVAAAAPGAVNISGKTTLPEFVELVRLSDAVVCNETSSIGISSAVGTPVACMMTGVREFYGPLGVKCEVLQSRPGCYEPVGEHCFCPHGYRCLQDITPAEVLSAALRLLD